MPAYTVALLVVVVAAQLALKGSHPVTGLVFVGAIGLWGLVMAFVRSGHIGSKTLVVATFAALTIAVAFPPATSKDVNSYALYGRMTTVYNVSPYDHTPRDFAGDPWYPRTSYYWADSPSVYGPVFSGISAGIMSIAGDSELGARLGFQLVAAASLLACCLVVARSRGRVNAFAFLGLNPLLLTIGVNDAHCDMTIGLLVLVGVVLLARAKPMPSAIAFVLASMIKISAAPALAGAAVWLYFTKGWGTAARFVGAAAATLAVCLAFGGGLGMFSPLSSASLRHTRFSVWAPMHSLLTAILGSGAPTQGPADSPIGKLSGAVVLVLALLLIWRHRRDASPVVAVVVGLVVYQVMGAYVLAWYVAWSLPALALLKRSRTSDLALGHAYLIAIAYFSGYLAWVAVLALVAILVRVRLKPAENRTGQLGEPSVYAHPHE